MALRHFWRGEAVDKKSEFDDYFDQTIPDSLGG